MDTLRCIATRRSVGRLAGPGPARAQLEQLLEAAVAAPDHGLLRPWRFLVLSGAALVALGDVYAAAHAARDPLATPGDLAKTGAKPLRAPTIVVVVAAPKPSPKIPPAEQVASADAAAQNLLLAAHAMGLGAMWRTGWYGTDPLVRAHLGLRAGEVLVGWIYLGTVPDGWTPPPRTAVDLEQVVTWSALK